MTQNYAYKNGPIVIMKRKNTIVVPSKYIMSRHVSNHRNCKQFLTIKKAFVNFLVLILRELEVRKQ